MYRIAWPPHATLAIDVALQTFLRHATRHIKTAHTQRIVATQRQISFFVIRRSHHHPGFAFNVFHDRCAIRTRGRFADRLILIIKKF